jgi:hypothetical protein
MNPNTTHNKILTFAVKEITFSEFEDILKNQATRSNPVKVGWITEEGRNRFYDMWWDESAYVGGNAGGSDTKALVDMYNVPVIGESGDWRTVDFNTVYKIRFNNKSYKVIN